MSFAMFHYFTSLLAVIILVLIGLVGGTVTNLHVLFGIIIPYVALLTFLAGIVYRVIKWARIPVPFRIPTTTGQQKSLPWMKQSLRDKIENPPTTFWAVIRMAFEVLFFRSLFRNLRSSLIKEPDVPGSKRIIYWSSKWLWLGAIAFHYTLLVIVIRHLWLFTEPVPSFVRLIQDVDSFFQLWVPAVYMSGIVFLAALTYLLARRLADPKLQYISLFADYFPLLMLLAIGITGILMRYFFKVDMVAVKELTVGLATFRPHIPEEEIGAIFFVHLFLVSFFFAYFPFSKLAHLAGIFMSMTRNMANNNRAVRHVNPWNYPVRIKTYLDQENDWRPQMQKMGLPLEISPEEAEEMGPEKLKEKAREQEKFFQETSGKYDAPVFPEIQDLIKQQEKE